MSWGPTPSYTALTLFVSEGTVSQLYSVKNLSIPEHAYPVQKDPSYDHFINEETEAPELSDSLKVSQQAFIRVDFSVFILPMTIILGYGSHLAWRK